MTTASRTPVAKVTGASRKAQQFKALLAKRFHHHKRDVRNYISQIVLPCLFILLAMGCTLINPTNTHMPSLLLTPDLYENPSDHLQLTMFIKYVFFFCKLTT
jgi:hypothetical protein